MKGPNEYVKEITQWARSCSTVLALALVGSHARNEAGPDSDIDFLIICHGTSQLIDDLAWVKRFGEIVSCEKERWGIVTSIRVVYVDGPEIEFSLAPLSWTDIPVDEGTYQVVSDGMTILTDSRNILGKLKKAVLDK